MAFFKVFHKLLDVMKSVDIQSVLPVAQPAQDLQVLLSTARMRLEMIPDLLTSSDPLEVADLAFGPGEGLQVGERAGEDHVADPVSLDTKMFQPEMPEDVLQSLVVVSVPQPAEPAGESELQVTLLDVTLSGLALAGDSLATVGAGPGQDTAR